MPTSRLLPMLAVPGRPGDVAGDGWWHEYKWDGVRVLAVGDGQRLQLRSRQGNDVTAAYPELQPLAAAAGRPALLDGEVVALDADGVPSFARLQQRMHVRDPHRIALLAARVPVHLILFDVLMLDGDWLLGEPYEKRRTVLEQLELDGPSWSTPPASTDLAAMLEEATRRGLEGVVSKRAGSPYRPGQRSEDWRKLRLMTEQEFVVGGYRHGEGRRAGGIGALLVGYHDVDGALRYAGGVGTGFSDRELTRLETVLAPLVQESSPFLDAPRERDVVWVLPEVVVQVRFREWTPEGRLRQPAYKGQRTDIDPAAVVRET